MTSLEEEKEAPLKPSKKTTRNDLKNFSPDQINEVWRNEIDRLNEENDIIRKYLENFPSDFQ